MIEVIRASEIGESARAGISAVFVDGFGKHFTYFSKDPARLTRALAHMFVLDLFYVARVDGQIAGITACTNGRELCIQHSRRELVRHLGMVRGTLASMAFSSFFQNPLAEAGDRIASVEFVATASAYRGKGVASAIMQQLFALPQFDQFILEVADTNTPAVNLYTKLGYREFKRVRTNHSRWSGINAMISMRYTKLAAG